VAETWTVQEARSWIVRPGVADDKYSRGVLGFTTGSQTYPGAAVIGIDAALHAGVGMCRYEGPESVTRLVIARRPEAVPGPGRVQARVIGSGIAVDDAQAVPRLRAAMEDRVPLVVDAGALPMLATEALSAGPRILTPHAAELAGLLGVAREVVLADPAGSAGAAARRWESVVLLKGFATHVTDGSRTVLVAEATPWLATAGSGDALAGILGALLAGHEARGGTTSDDLIGLGATAAFVHGRAALLASERNDGGPFTILELNAAVAAVIGRLAG